jgi:hypothetical protein
MGYFGPSKERGRIYQGLKETLRVVEEGERDHLWRELKDEK